MKKRKTSSPAELQARRIRWASGASRSLARTIAGLAYGEVRT